MSTLASEVHSAPFGTPPRPLGEDVLQSAEQVVLANPASVEILRGGELEPEAAGTGVTRAPFTERLARRAAKKPVQSALLALAAGALLAGLVKAALKRRP